MVRKRRTETDKRVEEKRKRNGSTDSPDEAVMNDSITTIQVMNMNNPKKFATSAKVLHMNELQVVFHLPMAEAAVKLGVCSTVLKKICRKNGISRWPYRQIRKIDKAVEELEQSHNSKGVNASEAANEDFIFKKSALKKLRHQIIDNPEIDRSNELGAALTDKSSNSDDVLTTNDFIGIRVGTNLIDSTTGNSTTGGGGVNQHADLNMSSHHAIQPLGSSPQTLGGNGNLTGNQISKNSNNLLMGTGGLGGVGGSGGAGQNHLINGINSNSQQRGGVGGGGIGGNTISKNGVVVGQNPRDLMEMFPLESYNPANLKTVFPRDVITTDVVDTEDLGYGFGGSLGLVDVSWNDNADPCTGMMLYRGENYEWLASHAAVVRGGETTVQGSGGTEQGGGGADIMDGGPIIDTIRTRQQNRISVDRGLCPILPAIDVTDITKLSKPDLFFALDSEAFGPFDMEECKAGITIW